MPSTNLFGITNKGRIFTLQTDKTVWKELPYLGIDFKRVSAHDNVIWALGGDHQIYVYVYGTSVPIRVCEESYENQRWNPVESFTSNLLPTDRPNYSSKDGLSNKTLSLIHLPSLAWNWESAWHLLDSFEGKALDKECWSYAVDFPRSFTAEKRWNSCVRRRKWIRYRRYIALDTWSSVASIHKDPTEEPFIDIAVGGGDVVSQDSDQLMVWGITAQERVMVRDGICATSPEGCKWTHVETPSNQEVTYLSVGRSGRVWAVTWDGKVLVRMGVSREHPQGCDWAVVEPPEGDKLQHIAVGVNVVWAICRDYSIWFRRGLSDDHTDVGLSWLNMVGSLCLISIGPNDQVWGLTEDHTLVIRTGVIPSELTGKEWKKINLAFINFDPDNPDCNADQTNSFDDDTSSSFDISDTREIKSSVGSEQSLAISEKENESYYTTTTDDSTSAIDKNVAEDITVSPSSDDVGNCSNEFSDLKIRNPDDSITSSIYSSSEVNFIGTDYVIKDTVPIECREATTSVDNNFPKSEATTIADNSSPKSEAFSLKSFNKRDRSGSTTSSINSDIFKKCVYVQEEQPYYNAFLPEENIWLWVSGGGCWVQPQNLPKWFIAELEVANYDEPWRKTILEKLEQRNKQEIEPFKCYSEAVESSSWTINGQCRFLLNGQWVPATLELRMIGSKGKQIQEASFSIIYTTKHRKKTLIPCCSIVLSSLIVDLPAKAVVSLYTSNQPLEPIPLLFSAEKDAEDWLNHISSACIKYRGLDHSPSGCSMWAITTQGAIYVHDVASSEQEMRVESKAANCTETFDENCRPPLTYHLKQNFRPGCFVSLTALVPEDSHRFSLNLSLDEECSSVALHFNPRFDKRCLVMNSKENNSWMNEERWQPMKCFSKGKKFEITILCDDTHMKITVDGKLQYKFYHRVMPNEISYFKVEGGIIPKKIVYNFGAGEKSFRQYFWQGVGGHLRHIECGAGGVTWGVSYDTHVYTYTGAKGGGIFKGTSSSDSDVYLMSDVRYFYVWENQRWNPLGGFSYRGLPTDRNTWSDQTGRIPRTKDSIKLQSRHWQWISDWTVDHHTPGGVDKDGWQYATDFPTSYHPHRYLTDLVRRRRWIRRARISTAGPWKQMDKVALISISVSPCCAGNQTVPVWGVSVSNEVVYREGVTSENVEGSRWVLIPSETKMKNICASVTWGVWAICHNGVAHFRMGTTKTNPKGTHWVNIDAPCVPLKQIGFGNWKVWAIDSEGSLFHRVHVQLLFPEGTSWEKVCDNVENISVSSDGSLWAILSNYTSDDGVSTASGVLALRSGVTPETPGGTFWDICTGTGWSHISVRVPIP